MQCSNCLIVGIHYMNPLAFLYTVKPANADTPWDHGKILVFTMCWCVSSKGLVMMENC